MSVRVRLHQLKLNIMDFELTIKNVCEFMDKHNITYSIDTHPTPERIREIKDKIKRKEEFVNLIRENYEKGI